MASETSVVYVKPFYLKSTYTNRGELSFYEVMWRVHEFGTVPRIWQIAPSEVDVDLLRVGHNAA